MSGRAVRRTLRRGPRPKRHDLDADYIVVGAGAAGAVVAARLSEDPTVSVLLLEAGPPDRGADLHVPAAFSRLFRGQYDWGYDTVAQPALNGRTVFWPRGRTLGGSSSLNAMMWVRGFAADYDEWADLAGPSWSWASLAPVFARIERTQEPADPTHGTDGVQSIERQRDPRPHTAAFLDAARAAGHEVTPANLPSGQGFSETVVTQHNGARASTADTYLQPARPRRSLRIVTDAFVRRITFDLGDGTSDAPPRATGVYVEIDGVTRHAQAEREVILCGGSVNTSQLLMLSGIGPAAHLRENGIPVIVDSPEVGENLQDHLASGLVPTASGGTLFGAQSGAQLAQYLARRRGMLTSNVAEAYGFVRTEMGGDNGTPPGLPDIEIVFAPAPYVGEGLTPMPAEGITVGAVLLRPHSRGSVRIESSDPRRAPLIDPRYLSDPAGLDERTLRAGLRECQRLLETDALRGLTTGGWLVPEGGERMTVDERIDVALRQHAHTLYHPVGTARMGVDAASVVDPQLRVRGVSGLRVADASVMPSAIRGHSQAPTMVIGEVAADLLRRAR